MITAILLGVLLGTIPTIIIDLAIFYFGDKFLPGYISFAGFNQTTMMAMLKLILIQAVMILIASIVVNIGRAILPGMLGYFIGLAALVAVIVGTYYALGMVSGSGITFSSEIVKWIMSFILSCTGNATNLTKRSN